MSKIVVWSTPACIKCNATKRWLDKRGLAYEERQLLDDLEKLEEFRGQGMLQAPIVEVEGLDAFSDYRPDLLDQARRLLQGDDDWPLE